MNNTKEVEMELLEKINIKNPFKKQKPKDAIDKFNQILEDDEIFSEIKATINKLETQIHKNNMAVEEIDSKIRQLEEYRVELRNRKESYLDVTQRLQDFI